MSDLQYRLIKHFAKPDPGEYVPIEFIEMTRETVAWSPKLKQSIYVTPDMPDAAELKRVREVNVLSVVNQLSGGISTIELTDEEKEQFENLHRAYEEKGGQILFSRKKVGRKTVSFFELSEEKEDKDRKKEIEVKSMLLSEKFEGE
jgi:2-oxo-4-hydroxy-4-carboxy--5-ureidoimidazoline (OHCU) decarboxylase